MAKKPDPLQAKAARQKKIVIVGSVLLLGLLAFQVPRTLKMMNGGGTATTSASTTAAGSATTPGANPLAPPSLAGGSASSGSTKTGSATASSGDGVQDPSVPLPPSAGQLVSFSRFKSKDPFQQQICASSSCANPTTPAPSAGTGGSTPSSGTTKSKSKSTGGGTGGGTGSSAGRRATTPRFSAPASTASAPKVTAAILAVNGVSETVSIGKDFPATAPVFLLVSASAKEAQIGIAGGSLQSGANTITLLLGKTVTLQNTADGTLYALKLLRTV